jgi:hypothetical protein
MSCAIVSLAFIVTLIGAHIMLTAGDEEKSIAVQVHHRRRYQGATLRVGDGEAKRRRLDRDLREPEA